MNKADLFLLIYAKRNNRTNEVTLQRDLNSANRDDALKTIYDLAKFKIISKNEYDNLCSALSLSKREGNLLNFTTS